MERMPLAASGIVARGCRKSIAMVIKLLLLTALFSVIAGFYHYGDAPNATAEEA